MRESILFMEIYERVLFYLWKFMRDLFIYGNLWERHFYLWKSMRETFLFMEIYERDLFIHENL